MNTRHDSSDRQSARFVTGRAYVRIVLVAPFRALMVEMADTTALNAEALAACEFESRSAHQSRPRSLADEAADFYSARRGFESCRGRHIPAVAFPGGSSESSAENIAAGRARRQRDTGHRVTRAVQGESRLGRIACAKWSVPTPVRLQCWTLQAASGDFVLRFSKAADVRASFNSDSGHG